MSTCRGPLPAHGAVPALAHRQEAERLYVCSARGSSAAGIDGNFCEWAVRPLKESFRSYRWDFEAVIV